MGGLYALYSPGLPGLFFANRNGDIVICSKRPRQNQTACRLGPVLSALQHQYPLFYVLAVASTLPSGMV